MGRVIYSIGTSKRELEDFLDILKTYQIKAAVDVRTFPVSKRFPQFCQETLSKVLEYSGIKYIYLGFELGGLRRGGYAKHTIKEEYERGINRLEEMAMSTNTVFFCCEKLFFKCHRRYIARTLKERGWRVFHILDVNDLREEM